MLITAVEPFTLLDFPGKAACILFTFGCNFKCGYCHNSQFVKPKRSEFSKKDIIPIENIFHFLEERKNFLDGVVVCGGEPTIQPKIIGFLSRIKSMGFSVKLDTNGLKPKVLKEIIKENVVDYLAMDIKASNRKYSYVSGIKVDFSAIRESKNLIMNSNIDYEFRTTVIKGVHDHDEIRDIAKFCKNAQRYVIQNFNNKKTLDPEFNKFTSFSRTELTCLGDIAKEFVETEVLF